MATGHEIIGRLESFIATKAKVSPSEFANRAKLDSSNFCKMLKGQQVITPKTLSKISDAWGVNVKWLTEGKEPIMNESPNEPIKSLYSGIPYYNVDFELGFDLMENDQTRNPDYMIDCPPYNKCDLWCNAHGDSMAPTIASGDIVALKLIEDFRYLVSGEIYALITKNGLRTIKRVNDNGNTFTLIPDNKDFAPQTLPKEEFTHVFAVKGSMKIF